MRDERLAVRLKALPESIRNTAALYVGCVAGAMPETLLIAWLADRLAS